MEICPNCKIPTPSKPEPVVSVVSPERKHAPLPPAQHKYKCGQSECGHTWVK